MKKYSHVRALQAIADWLGKPYPCPDDWRGRIVVSATVAALVYFILDSFQPFGISEINKGKLVFIFGYSFIIFIVMMLTSLTLPLVFQKFFDPARWNIGKYLIHVSIDYFIISVCSWYYTISAGHGFIEIRDFTSYLWVTFVVSLFPVLIVVYFYERILYARKAKQADFFSNTLSRFIFVKKTGQEALLTFSEKSGNLVIASNDFICAIANGNYSQIYYLQSEVVQKALIRITLTRLIEMSKTDPMVVRCHKSAVVNLRYIEKVGGNARNYYLKLKHTDLRIDVSRQIQSEVMEQFRNNVQQNPE